MQKKGYVKKWEIGCSHQERTEENERNEVGICKVAAALWSLVPRFFIAILASETCQHDLMPCLASGTPVTKTHTYMILKIVVVN